MGRETRILLSDWMIQLCLQMSEQASCVNTVTVKESREGEEDSVKSSLKSLKQEVKIIKNKKNKIKSKI